MISIPRTVPRPLLGTFREWRGLVAWFVLGSLATLLAVLYLAARAFEKARPHRDTGFHPGVGPGGRDRDSPASGAREGEEGTDVDRSREKASEP